MVTMAVILIRTLIIFTTLFISMRILGKRQLGELEISELVVSVLIADMACLTLQDIGIPMLNGLLSIITLFCLELLLSGITLHSPRLRAAVWGKPCFLIEKGVINQKEMRRNRFALDELTEELRRQSVTDIGSVEYAVLETDGTLNVILTPDNRPVTAGQMQVPLEDTGYPMIVISEGTILQDNLRKSCRDDVWLRLQCNHQGFSGPEAVYLMTVNAAGKVYCAGKEKGN